MIDFSDKTYRALLAAMLARVPNDVDKREESLVNTALGPAAYALEDAYLDLARIQTGSRIQTAVGEDLDGAAQNLGLVRKAATAAVRLGVFNIDVPIGARFSTSEAAPVNFAAAERISAGRYRMRCESVGEIGNRYTGALIAITFVAGLTSAEMADSLIPGDDEEGDEAFRARCVEHLNAKPFGGNAAYFREHVKGLDGVGGVQIYPVWDGGGTVKLSVLGADLNPASAELVQSVQTAVDPELNRGQGYGVAPIGARVTVSTPEERAVDVVAAVTVAQGYTLEQVTPELRAAAERYIASLRGAWDTPTVPGTTMYVLTAYRARLTSAMLAADGVVNVTGLTLNGVDADIQFVERGARQELPKLGTVVLRDGG